MDNEHFGTEPEDKGMEDLSPSFVKILDPFLHNER